MSAKQQVVYCNDGKRYGKIAPDFNQVYEDNCYNVSFVRDAVDGDIEEIIATLVECYCNHNFDARDVGEIMMTLVDDAMAQAVEDIVG